MSGFKSDQQRKHFFANHGEGSAGGAGVPSFVQPVQSDESAAAKQAANDRAIYGQSDAEAKAVQARNDSAIYGIDVQPGQHVHTIMVNGMAKYVALDESDRATPEEMHEMNMKEIRKSHDFQ
jgi:hypothetical protein